MKIRKLYFLIIISVILVSAIRFSPTQAQERQVLPHFGMNFHEFGFEEPSLTLAAQANNYWVRYNGLLWSEVQLNKTDLPANYMWPADLENDLINASSKGMEVILTVRSTPLWAQERDDGNYCGPIAQENFSDFAEFMFHVVDKYSDPPYNVKYYEIWNEPDAPYQLVRDHPHAVYGCWGEPDDPYFGGGHYGEMLKAVYPRIKDASSSAQVVLGSLLLPKDPEQAPKDWVHPSVSYNDYDIYWPYSDQSKYFEGVLNTEKGDGWPYFDVVNFNGYAFFDNLDLTGIQLEQNVWYWKDRGGQVEGKLNFLNEKMAEYGVLNKQIIQAETGLPLPNLTLWNSWDSAQRATYEAAKADYLVYLYTRNIAKGLAGTTWYHFSKYGWNRGGLLDSNNQPLPAYEAYQVMTNTLGDAIYQTELNLGDGIYGYEFMKGSYRIWVLFSEDGTEKTITKPAWSVNHVYDLLRNPVTQTSTTITFDRPIYIDNNPNQPPYLPPDVTDTVNEDELYSDTVTVTDSDFGDAHTLTATNLPDWLTLKKTASRTWTLSGTPRNDDVGVNNFSLTVRDSGGGSDTQNFKITVVNTNDPPKFTSLPKILAHPGELYTYNIKATDDDLIYGDSIKITGAVPNWLNLEDKGGGEALLYGTPGYDQIGFHPVSLTVTDKAGAKDVQNFEIHVIRVEDMLYLFLPLILR